MLLITLCVTFLPFAFESIDTTCLPPEEVDALREIGTKLGKDWDFEQDPCLDWTSPKRGSYENNVTCKPEPNNTAICHVVSIDLTRNYLSGTIPPQWGSMEQLRNISLIANRLNGSIPKELGNISTLLSLSVEDNMMSGIIPEELANLSSIDRLFFSSNFFTGELPASLAKLTTMREFRISGNNFSGKIPDFIGQWAGLQTLRIQASGLEGPIPSSITSFESLTNLDFSFNKLNGSIPASFSRLIEIDFIVPDWMLSNGKNTSRLLMNNPELYMSARVSPLSLTYYGFCMHYGSYNVSLHFAEIIFTDDRTYSSLGRRVFDIYIQGERVEKDFDISYEAGGVGKAIVKSYTVNVNATLLIRLNWAGKGTTSIPSRGVYGPLISAISVNPNFWVPPMLENRNGVSKGTVAGIVVGTLCLIVLILGALWLRCCLRRRNISQLELNGLELNTGSFTLRQIKAATNNFDVANKIGEGGFGSVYKGVLPDGTLIAVKQLSSKSRQGNREFLNELGVISALQHPHLVKLRGCCTEGNQLLLAYEYMENNNLAHALYGPKEWQLELDWPTRYRICIGIAKGLAFLHEESRLKIVHRDIKTTNVLLDKNLNAKISDFGMAKLDEEDNTHISTRIAGTCGYMAPEYALRGYLTDKADVYSYGIVLLEIVSGTSNVPDRTKENNFVLLDRAISLKNTGNLMELVDPKLNSKYDIQETMVVINLAILCTASSPVNRPTMSSVVSMLEGRIVPQEFALEQSVPVTEIDRHKMMKQLEDANESQIMDMSNPCTDSFKSAVDLYPVDGFSDYPHNRTNDTCKLLS